MGFLEADRIDMDVSVVDGGLVTLAEKDLFFLLCYVHRGYFLF